MPDLIIRRDEVQPGDLLLREGQLVTVLKVHHFPRGWGDTEKTFTDIEYRYQGNQKIFASDCPSDQLVAVRRDEGK